MTETPDIHNEVREQVEDFIHALNKVRTAALFKIGEGACKRSDIFKYLSDTRALKKFQKETPTLTPRVVKDVAYAFLYSQHEAVSGDEDVQQAMAFDRFSSYELNRQEYLDLLCQDPLEDMLVVDRLAELRSYAILHAVTGKGDPASVVYQVLLTTLVKLCRDLNVPMPQVLSFAERSHAGDLEHQKKLEGALKEILHEEVVSEGKNELAEKEGAMDVAMIKRHIEVGYDQKRTEYARQQEELNSRIKEELPFFLDHVQEFFSALLPLKRDAFPFNAQKPTAE